MLRSTFFSLGLFLLLWGVSFLFIDKVILDAKEKKKSKEEIAQQQPEPGFRGFLSRVTTTQPNPQALAAPRQKVLDPPDWVAFSLMSLGSVTMLYSLALPRKKKEGG